MRRSIPSLRAVAQDPYASSVVVIVALGLAGLVAIVLGANGAADAATVDAQLPYVVSGGLGGLALVAVAVGLHAAQRRRLAAARRRVELDGVLQAAAALLAEARAR
jgi:hypothetical protein